MLRNKNLIPLSHQHQHALALCVRVDRALSAGEVEPGQWQAEIQQIYEQEIGIHFAAEEQTLFPAAKEFSELRNLVEELLEEHTTLRDYFARAARREMSENELQQFARTLSAHIRKEERQLFEGMQQLMNAEQLTLLGHALEKELANASNACLLPNAATRLRPRRK